MRRALALLAVLAAGAAGACGDGERDEVERYIEAANAVQEGAAPELRRANEAYARFSKGELDTAQADLDLTAAEQTLRDARARIARLDPPPQAERLHQRLLRVYDVNAAFASESTRLGRYLPAARRVLRPLAKINERMRDRLRTADSPAAQASALARYGRGVYGQYSLLRKLDPPPVLLATHRTQLDRLLESKALSVKLSTATRRRDSRQVARLLLRFRKVTGQAGDAGLTRRAIREYNERYRRVTATAGALQREQVRVEQRLS